jgi:hypothetical protein
MVVVFSLANRVGFAMCISLSALLGILGRFPFLAFNARGMGDAGLAKQYQSASS